MARLNAEYEKKLRDYLSREDCPYSSQADFLSNLIINFFAEEEAKARQKEILIDFIKNDSDIAAAILERAIVLLSQDLNLEKKP
ncbi:hypothetical protein L1994_04370 [Methanomicrobium antiquum]|uniref:Uncharacterized protein n=1 Tax=Methanomicrobium antiquum TaxID=487686 RepID=A0AAF0JNJ5_9EURY|nr:hypothetical protein [Methanomicrobium antiquum]WFN37630.1 hypothetical protein L1994_04370 [Methanomicrobium antiquum]